LNENFKWLVAVAGGMGSTPSIQFPCKTSYRLPIIVIVTTGVDFRSEGGIGVLDSKLVTE
jgi:hypothetical protein